MVATVWYRIGQNQAHRAQVTSGDIIADLKEKIQQQNPDLPPARLISIYQSKQHFEGGEQALPGNQFVNTLVEINSYENPLYVHYDQPAAASASDLQDVLAAIHEKLAKMAKPETTQTPSKAAAERRQGVLPEQFDGAGDEQLSKGVLNKLEKCSSDSHNVNLIMEKEVLGHILPKHVLLVNCEDHSLGDGIGQPDFFGACCYTEKQPKKKDSARYGVPALMDSVTALFDGKTRMDGEAEDKMFRHLNATSASYGLLYTSKAFRLLIARGETTHKQLTRIVDGRWEKPGVVKFLAEECAKYQPLHERRLQKCLDRSETKMMEFLGMGKFGRVFQVKHRGTHFAMKVVADVEKLKTEVQKLEEYVKRRLPVVQPSGGVVDVVNEQFSGGYFLMRPVGEPLTKQLVQDQPSMLSKICGILAALHEAGVVHGDARIANIIREKHQKNKYLWVDFADADFPTDVGKTRDIVQLCKSLGVPEVDVRAKLQTTSLTDPGFQQWVNERISHEASRTTSSKRRRLA